MVKTIIKRELLDNILSFKFMACVLVALILSIISTIVLTKDYQARLVDYNKGVAIAQEKLSKIPVYSFLEVEIYKKPSPLSIFVRGLERETGNYVTLTHREIPTALKGGLAKNEFSPIFSFFDLSSVVVVVFTLLAILLSYNSVSGAKEEGVLSLILSNSVPRFKFLLGKYVGGLWSIFIPITLCFGIGGLIVLISRRAELSGGFWISFLGFYLLAVLYLSAVLLIGIFVSSRTKNSFTSLLILLAFYVITIFLLPVGLDNFAGKAEMRKAVQYDNNAPDLLREARLKTAEAVKKISVQRSWASLERRGERLILRRLNPEATIEYYRQFHEIRERIGIEYARKAYDLKQMDDHIADRIYGTKNLLQTFLPPADFERASETMAGTGRENIRQFFQQILTYWQQYVLFLEQKDAFSLRYFYPYSEKFSPDEKSLLGKLSLDWKDWKGRASRLDSEGKKYDEKEFEYLNLGDMPIFKFFEPRFGEKIKGISRNVLALFFYNLVFFLLAHFSFNRYDPRMTT
jgi:ABC-type transport system involved in multi-copper enzyme maturation permease subunit